MRTLKFEVTVPGIPETDQYSDEYVKSWLRQEIGHPYDAAYEADVTVELAKETYAAPKGYTWRYIGDCSCGGQDADHSANENEWRLVPIDANPERENNGCMVFRGPASQGA